MSAKSAFMQVVGPMGSIEHSRRIYEIIRSMGSIQHPCSMYEINLISSPEEPRGYTVTLQYDQRPGLLNVEDGGPLLVSERAGSSWDASTMMTSGQSGARSSASPLACLCSHSM